jgi:UDP-sugar pyrophosphorylase
MQIPDLLHRNMDLLTPADLELVGSLLLEDQSHLFQNWDEPGTRDEEKRAFLDALLQADRAYPGGLPGYIRNARKLLAEAAAGANPFADCVPLRPDCVDLSSFGPAYDEAEAIGWRCFADTGVVLVAGGLGERLGYHGIKLDIPVEVTEGTSYLAHYCGVIRLASRRLGREIPLVIMTSRETDPGTRATLAAANNFGLAPGQITILCQELVPSLSDIQAHLSLDGKYQLGLKPHGHGDVHLLLHSSGTAQRLAAAGVRYLLFIQDTNGQVFNAAFAAIGVSEQRGYDFNSIAVNRIPGEAVGGIARLQRPGAADLTINVEYNQLDPLLRATVNPAGDVAESNGFSAFPGNINLLVVRMQPYLTVLQSSGGIVAEFVNPKFADASKTTFKKPARLETLMQDLPKLFTQGEKTGVTIFARAWCFSACKNNLEEAAAKVRNGGPPESASSAENDFYAAGRQKLRQAGVEVQEAEAVCIHGIPWVRGPRVILRPGVAQTLAEVRERFSGGRIEGEATVILDGDIRWENVEVPSGEVLAVKVADGASLELRNLTVQGKGHYRVELLNDEEMTSLEVPEYLRIRGYRIVPEKVQILEITEPGRWLAEGSLAALRKI